jgi:hypothetical protein
MLGLSTAVVGAVVQLVSVHIAAAKPIVFKKSHRFILHPLDGSQRWN